LLETGGNRERDKLFNVLVIDNGSPLEAKKLIGLFEEVDVQFIWNSENLGFTKAINQGIDACEGDIIPFNSDAVPRPGWFEPLREAAYCEDKIACVCPQHLLGNDKRCNTSLNDLTTPEWPKYKTRPDGRVALYWAGFTCVYLRRDAINSVGKLDEQHWHYCSDEFWCRHATEKGWTILYESRSLVNHFGEASLRELVVHDIELAREKIDSRFGLRK